MNYSIEAKTKEEYIRIYDTLALWGYKKWSDQDGKTFADQWFRTHKHIGVVADGGRKQIDAWASSTTVRGTIGEFFNQAFKLSLESITVKLNAGYNAIVTPTDITIGDYKFPHSIVAELEKAIKQVA